MPRKSQQERRQARKSAQQTQGQARHNVEVRHLQPSSSASSTLDIVAKLAHLQELMLKTTLPADMSQLRGKPLWLYEDDLFDSVDDKIDFFAKAVEANAFASTSLEMMRASLEMPELQSEPPGSRGPKF
jgi:hypothetical protein